MAIPEENKGREEKGKGALLLGVTNGKLSSGQQREKRGGGKGSKKEPLHSYRADTNACNIHRTTK